MTDPIATALLADAATRADVLRLRLRGALEAMRTALAVMVVEPEHDLARYRLGREIILSHLTLEQIDAAALEASNRSEAA